MALRPPAAWPEGAGGLSCQRDLGDFYGVRATALLL